MPSLRSLLLPNPAAPLRDVASMVARDTSAVGSLARRAFARPSQPVVRDGTPEERFQATMALLGKTEADLPEMERGAGNRLEAWTIALMVAVLWLVLSPVLGLLGAGPALHALDFAYPLALIVLVAAKAFAASVSLYRLERRAMLPVSAWWKERKSWLGRPPSRGLVLLAVVLGTSLSSLFPSSAFAQGAAVAAAGAAHSAGAAMGWLTSSLGADDLSADWLRRLFPGAMSMICLGASCPTGGGGDPRAAMFGVLNSILLALGAFMLAYHTLLGTISTAHEGKVMGSRWHTFYAPIRIVVGMGFLVPLQGYCMAQILVLQVIFSGYSMANQIWVTYARTSLSGEMAAVATSQNPMMGTRLAQSVAASEACAAVLLLMQQQIEAHSTAATRLARHFNLVDTGVPSFASPSPAGRPAGGRIEGRTWSWGSACGQVTTSAGTPPVSTAGSVAGGASRGGVTGAVQGYRESAALTAAYAEFMRKRDEAVAALVGAVRTAGLHETLRDATAPNTRLSAEDAAREGARRYALVLEAGAAFDRAVDEAAREMVAALNARGGEDMVRRAEALGWASAGSTNSTLVRAAARAQEVVGSAAPSAAGPDTAQLTRGISNAEARTRMERAMRVIQELGRDLNPMGQGGGQSVNLGADLSANGVLSQVLAPVSQALTRAATDSLGYLDPVRPMASIQNTGTVLMSAGTGLAVSYMGARGAAEGVAGQQVASFFGGGVPKGVLEAAGPYVTTVSMALIVMGAMNAYVIPLMGFIIWFFAIFGVVALAVQLVVAAPIAALLHVRADGPELINQEQRTIYVMGFNAFLRPTLLLFGLAFANVVFGVMAGFLNATFGLALSSTNGDSIIGLFGFITLTALVLYLHYQLAVRSMHLVTAIPAAVSELLGAKDASQEEVQQSTTVLAGVSGGAGRAGNSAATSSIRNLERKPVGGRLNPGGPGSGGAPRPASGAAPAG